MIMFLNGDEIAAIRRAHGETLCDFGKRFGVTAATVSRWESNQRRPRYDMMETLNELAEKVGKRKLAAAAS